MPVRTATERWRPSASWASSILRIALRMRQVTAERARRWQAENGAFFDWYNHEHRHSGIGLMTPAMVHYGQAEAVREERAQVLATAYAAHPERFVKGLPNPPRLPKAAWINEPKTGEEAH